MSYIESYIEHDLALIPIPRGQKGPNTSGWNERGKAIVDRIRAASITGNVGLAHQYCKRPTMALDIDDLEGSRAWFKEHNIDLDALLNAPDAVQITSGRPNRCKLVYRLPPRCKSKVTCQVKDPTTSNMLFELRCSSANDKTMQDVLPPSIHPDTGKPYTWAGRGSYTKLPTIPPALFFCWSDRQSAGKPIIKSTCLAAPDTASIGELKLALGVINADDRALWVKCGLALKGLGDPGRVLWLEWSARSDKFDEADALKKWASFNPTGIDYRCIFNEAKRQSLGTNVGIPAIKGIPQRLPGELKLVTAFDPALFPQSIRAGVVDISERLNCSIDYVAIAVLAGAGAVLGNSVGVWPKEHDETWIVHPSLWGGIVGSPGSMKTPALNAALKPVHELEEIAATKYKTDYLAYTKAMADYEKAMNSGSGSIPQVPAKPIKKRYTVNDVTYQALGLLLADNPQGILALSDELSGLLQSLDTQGQEAARGFFLSGWGGQGFYTFDRVGRGPVSLTRYSVAVFGGFQPDRIRAYVRSAQGGSTQNDGLLQRFQLLVWPDQPATFTLIDRPANKAALSSMHQAITNLDMLSKLGITGATRINSGPQLLHFAPDAQLVFNKWLHANEVLLRSGTLSSSESSHFAKYRSLIPALALLFHLLDGNQDLIKLEYLEAAIGFSEYLQSHAKRIYASINGQDHAPIRALAEKLISGGVSDGFTQRSLLHKGWANLSKEASVKMALDALVEYGWLMEHESTNPGRKTTIYTINANIGAHLL